MCNKFLLNMSDIHKSNAFTFGFTTASGSSINVSDKALSKAKKLFTEELKEPDSNEDITDRHKQINALQTASNRQLAITETTLQRTGNLFLEECEINRNIPISSMGFQTAGGSSINVSDKTLLKAKKLFTEELNETDSNEKITDRYKQTNELQSADNSELAVTKTTPKKTGNLFFKKCEINRNIPISSMGFQTAGGSSINVSHKALLKAKKLFTEELNETDSNEEITDRYKQTNELQSADNSELAVTKTTPKKTGKLFFEECEINRDIPISSMGFKTAGGNSINVSDKALSSANQLFINDLDDTDEYKRFVLTEKETIKSEIGIPNIRFQTASGQNINITKEALTKAKTLCCEETSTDFENDLLLTKSLQKRKLKDLDDDKQITSNHFKKLRFSNESQIPKTVCNGFKMNEKQNQSPISTEALIKNCESNGSDASANKTAVNKESSKINNNFSISHEIEASTVALLADEINSDFSEQWSSPVEITKNEDNSNVPSSPVIGGHFVPKKRKYVNGKKKNINFLKNEEYKPVNIENLKHSDYNCVISKQHTKEENKLLIENQESVSKEIKSDTSGINDFGDTQLMLHFINESANVLEKRLEAAIKQEKQISLQKRIKPKPTISKLYFHRKSNFKNRVSWREISRGNKPILCTHEELIEEKLPPELLDVTAENALAYKFRCSDFYGQEFVQNNIDGIRLEDDACLILDENGYIGIFEIKRSFLVSPGVDPNLVPAGWVENHYRWIVWKLASMDRISLNTIKLPRALTPARVMMELKYRYDREIDRSQRSALKRILEKDDVASKRMVLCVSSIECSDSTIVNRSPKEQKISSIKLTLTDGWYSVPASIDRAMIKYITSGKLKEGTKLMTYGAELLNCDQGCSPLEVPENVCLKIHTNSTRRAKWDTRLGYIVPSGPMCIKLNSICSNGGLIGKITILIARVYPILYHEKTTSGESIFRNARCEEKANIAREKERKAMIETLYAKAERYFSDKMPKDSDPDSLDLAASEWNENREILSKEEFLTKHEQEQLVDKCRMKEEQFRKKLESRLHKSLPPPRQVTPLLKIRVVEEETTANLSVWSPNEEILDILKEGNCVSICNVMSVGNRGNELQLSANRNAIFNRINTSQAVYSRRTYTPLCNINKITFSPTYGEFDTVGIVISIGKDPFGMKNFEAVYLAYPHSNSQSSYLSVLFWHGISSSGYAEILTVGSILACSNLEWRRASPWNIPISYYTDRSTFTRNPRQGHCQQAFNDCKHLMQDMSAYIATCTTDIAELQKKSPSRTSDQFIPDRNSLNKTTFSETPDKQFGNSVSSELLGRNVMNHQTTKSVAIQKRLKKLQHYGEPSSLSPIVLKNSSKRVSLDFQSPLRTSDENQIKSRTSLNTYFQNSR